MVGAAKAALKRAFRVSDKLEDLRKTAWITRVVTFVTVYHEWFR